MADPEIDNPLKGEAEAQDEQTIMPWLWGAVGLLVIAGFVAWILVIDGHHPPHPPAAAPTVKSQPY